jgi:hypothetical protein
VPFKCDLQRYTTVDDSPPPPAIFDQILHHVNDEGGTVRMGTTGTMGTMGTTGEEEVEAEEEEVEAEEEEAGTGSSGGALQVESR